MGLESCGLLLDCCHDFISCLDSHSDGTHSQGNSEHATVYIYITKNVFYVQRENCT